MLLSFHTLTFTAFVFTQLTFGHPPSHALTFIAFPFTQLAFSHFYHLLIFTIYSFLDFTTFVITQLAFIHFDLRCLCIYTKIF